MLLVHLFLPCGTMWAEPARRAAPRKGAETARSTASSGDLHAELARRLNAGQLPAAVQLGRASRLDPQQLLPALRYAYAEALLAAGGELRQQGIALLHTLLVPEEGAAPPGSSAPAGANPALTGGSSSAAPAGSADDPPLAAGAATEARPAPAAAVAPGAVAEARPAPAATVAPGAVAEARPVPAATEPLAGVAAEPLPTPAVAERPRQGAGIDADPGPGEPMGPVPIAQPLPAAAVSLPTPLAPLARTRLAEVLEQAGRAEQALQLLEEMDRAGGAAMLRLATAALRARLLEKLGRPEALLAFAEEVRPLLWLPGARAELDELGIRAAAALGQDELAALRVERLLEEQPRSIQAERLLQRQGLLRRLLHHVDHPSPTTAWVCQELPLQRALAAAPPAEREQVRPWAPYLRGVCRLQAKSFAAAQEQFDLVLAEPTADPALQARALFGRAISLRRRDLDLEGAASYRLLALRHPRHALAPQALFEASGLDRLSNEPSLAELDLQLLRGLTAVPAGPLLARSRWAQAWLQLSAGRVAAAAEMLDQLGREHPEEPGHSRGGMAEQAQYWQARARAELGQLDRAVEQWATVVSRFPLTYYSHLSLAQLTRFAPERAAALRRSMPRLDPARPRRSSLPPLSPRPEVAAAIAFAGAGLPRLALRELRLMARARSLEPAELDHLASLYEVGDEITTAYFTARTFGHFDRYPDAGTTIRWELAHPRPYAELVERYAAAERIDPMLVWAVMRQESAFNPRARSPAGALGLMQLMPATARFAGRRLGVRVREAELYQPEPNIKLACHVLRNLLDLYDGNVVLAVTAYNAGPGNVRRWRERWGMLENDRWAEEIPFREAHGYVKKVIEALGAYHHLYDVDEGG
ncbi:MAG: tetratricopeptide repeat protein [Deltaproteobacteria bacterium]|nr:tetratricopeptide repeat protein [Deltaproteobacteria bacterium]